MKDYMTEIYIDKYPYVERQYLWKHTKERVISLGRETRQRKDKEKIVSFSCVPLSCFDFCAICIHCSFKIF